VGRLYVNFGFHFDPWAMAVGASGGWVALSSPGGCFLEADIFLPSILSSMRFLAGEC
jgi:hypothetical protein